MAIEREVRAVFWTYCFSFSFFLQFVNKNKNIYVTSTKNLSPVSCLRKQRRIQIVLVPHRMPLTRYDESNYNG